METKLETYLSVAEKVIREIAEIGPSRRQYPQYVAENISRALDSEIQYAYIDLGTNTIYESSAPGQHGQAHTPLLSRPKRSSRR